MSPIKMLELPVVRPGTRNSADRRVEAAGGDCRKRTDADSRIFIAGIQLEGFSPNRRVTDTLNVVKEGESSKGRI